ncbi:hypothetical protein ZIOFF_038114 [Zingiber officinale]|uniref:Uncharacterized protein n=1 Tax=Zingiber officinale TaxID=94328 RepID=A0A8J5L4S5_ZINOF|nr:hypothetical protein ZIOFF_038114 [Zingiber officinale]
MQKEKTLLLVCGYPYPAYECYKTIELNKQEIRQWRFWCQYYKAWRLPVFVAFPDKKHESEIDQSLFEFRARAANWGLIAWQMAVSYLQTSVPEMKKYAISLMPTMNSIEQQTVKPNSLPVKSVLQVKDAVDPVRKHRDTNLAIVAKKPTNPNISGLLPC